MKDFCGYIRALVSLVGFLFSAPNLANYSILVLDLHVVSVDIYPWLVTLRDKDKTQLGEKIMKVGLKN